MSLKSGDKLSPDRSISATGTSAARLDALVKETIYKAFEHSYLITDADGDILEITGDVSRYISFGKGKMSASLFKLAHKDLKTELRSLIEQCAKENKEVKSGLRKISTKGRGHHVKINVYPLQLSENTARFYLVIFEEVKNQDALKQKQKLFNAIATYFPNGIIGILDRDLRYIFAGGTELHKLGLDHDVLIGDKIFDKIHPGSNEFAEPYLKKTFAGEKVSFEVTISGNAYLVISVPVSDHEGPISQSLVVIRNITQQKQTEEALMKAIEKQKDLNELKTKFVSMASHEFRTPLSTILSSTSLIEKYNKAEDESKREKHLTRIKTSVHNLTDILNDFLTLGKMEEGGVKNNPALVDIRQFFKELTDDMRPNLKPGQELLSELHADCDMAWLDVKHFKNVLLNLLSNAIKYSPEGKKIYLNSVCGNGYIEVSVRDEGMGIPEADQEHLFSTFFRANNVTNIQGTGMGLHIVKRYLDLMGGTISFWSRLDEGTTFTVRLPQTDIGAHAEE